MTTKPEHHCAELMRAFQIQLEDREANGAGRLSPAQGRKLLSNGNSNLAGTLLIRLLLAGILYGVIHKPLVPAEWITALICLVWF